MLDNVCLLKTSIVSILRIFINIITASTKDTDIDLSSTMDCGPQLSLAVAIPLMITSFFIGVIIMLVVISVTCIFARKWKRCSHQRGCDADKHDTCELEIKI